MLNLHFHDLYYASLTLEFSVEVSDHCLILSCMKLNVLPHKFQITHIKKQSQLPNEHLALSVRLFNSKGRAF